MPTTPTKAGRDPKVESTPNSRGTRSHQTYETENKQSQYAPYLQEDLFFEVRITVDDFFRKILAIDEPADATLFSDLEKQTKKYSDFTKFKNEYVDEIEQETDLYHPFVELANLCIGEGATIIFCRDDPRIILGSPGKRKPDVVGINWVALKLGGRFSADECRLAGPPEDSAFHWLELLSFFEFKYISSPPTTPTSSKPQSRASSKPQSRASSSKPQSRASSSKPQSRASSSKPRSRKSSLEPRRGPPRQAKETSASQRHWQTQTSSTKRSADDSASGNHAKKPKLEDPVTQCASYALELFAYGGLRSHVIGALITNNEMELLYYDRSVLIRSYPFNFIEDSARFLNLLNALKNLTKVQWGYHPLVDPPNIDQIMPHGVLRGPFKGNRLRLKKYAGDALELEDTIFQSHGLIGRGTCVTRATSGGGKAVIVKWSWPAKTRKAEAEFLKAATNKAKEEAHSWVRPHLPNLLHSEEQEFGPETPQHKLHALLGDKKYEIRELRIAVFDELYPITDLTNAQDLGKAFYDIFKCYRWLYEVAGIMHRDISLNNVMFRREPKDGKVHAVLNDFDLAVYWKDPSLSSTSNQRTGTKPFMARELLVVDRDPPAHVYRFDLESLFYVMVFAMYHYHEGKEIDNPPYRDWTRLGTAGVLKEKESFFAKLPPEPTANFVSLKPLLHAIHGLFAQYFTEQVLNEKRKAQLEKAGVGAKIDFGSIEETFLTELPAAASTLIS